MTIPDAALTELCRLLPPGMTAADYVDLDTWAWWSLICLGGSVVGWYTTDDYGAGAVAVDDLPEHWRQRIRVAWREGARLRARPAAEA